MFKAREPLLVRSASQPIRVSCCRYDFLLGVTSVSSTPGPRECVLICEKTSFFFLKYTSLFISARLMVECQQSLFRLTELKICYRS